MRAGTGEGVDGYLGGRHDWGIDGNGSVYFVEKGRTGSVADTLARKRVRLLRLVARLRLR